MGICPHSENCKAQDTGHVTKQKMVSLMLEKQRKHEKAANAQKENNGNKHLPVSCFLSFHFP